MNNPQKLDRNSEQPLHIQAEKLIRKLIVSPEFANGQLLPKEIELAKQLGISRSTLRHVLNKLVYDGLLIRKKGVGTTVAKQVIPAKSTEWLSFSQEMNSRGIAIKNFEMHISWVNPEEEVAHFFNLKNNEKTLKLERLRGKPDDPFVYFISYFNPQIGLTAEEDFNRPLYEILRTDYSISVHHSQEEISAVSANKFIADKFDIAEGSPVLLRRRFVFDNKRNPIEFNVGYYKANNYIYSVTSAKEALLPNDKGEYKF